MSTTTTPGTGTTSTAGTAADGGRASAGGTSPRHGRRTPIRRRSELAEGVISTAIAVLIVAFLGIALWKGFDAMMTSATDKTRNQVEQIGG
jgi:hypothetical protein